MSKIAEKLQEIITREETKNFLDNKFEELKQVIDEMRKSGFIKAPQYTFPLVDTIGKNYYPINKKRPLNNLSN